MLTSLEALRHVPVLPRGLMASLLRKQKSLVMIIRHLARIIRHLARIIPLMTSPGMRAALGWDKLMLSRHNVVRRHGRSANILSERELSPEILRFAFLTLVKTSQVEDPSPDYTRIMNVQGLSIVLGNCNEIDKESSFGLSSLPVVPNTAFDFVKTLFYTAHVEFDPGLTDYVTQKHHGFEATLARIDHQVWRFAMRDLRGTFKKLLARCKFCKKTKLI